MRWAAAPIPGISGSAAEPITAIDTRRMAHGACLKDEPAADRVTPPVVSPTRNPEDPDKLIRMLDREPHRLKERIDLLRRHGAGIDSDEVAGRRDHC